MHPLIIFKSIGILSVVISSVVLIRSHKTKYNTGIQNYSMSSSNRVYRFLILDNTHVILVVLKKTLSKSESLPPGGLQCCLRPLWYKKCIYQSLAWFVMTILFQSLFRWSFLLTKHGSYFTRFILSWKLWTPLK